MLASPAAAAINNQDPSKFIETLSNDGFAVLRNGSRASAKAQFRTMLAQHFAVDAIGDRLIRRWLPTISPQQKAAYKAAFPNYIVGTYADRLFEYADADLRVVRAMPLGGGVEVTTQVLKPGQQPVVAIWSVAKAGSGYKVTNLKVAGINLAIAQAADFDAIVQRKGFDALVAQMKARG
ncbi:toluene tolerance protein [Sphingomonas oleivorans]|uniref:Toluene tolerance protein n=2 Tax=Sphingomonas oleivorans TaxID=1735121 RepID=A0A2T5FX32_9SPHN|nr:toluene tolerance protein [Sphingomonas oleivorans]